MPLPADSITVVRKWIGDEPVDAALEALFEVYGTYDGIVLHVLNNRLAALTLDPSSITVPGLSVSHGSDLQALQLLLKQFHASGGTGLDETPASYGFAIQSIRRNYPR
jgi:hypothetical protein